MAELNFTEKELENRETMPWKDERCEAITGGENKNRFLLYQLKYSMMNADRIDIIVSFLMESGVRMLLKDLQRALERGTRIRILTGNYLGITQPGALYLIKDALGDQIDLRFYKEKERSFHPKAYIFHKKEFGEIYIGSSNVSRSALTSGIEWNYHFDVFRDKDNFNRFFENFEDLFYNHSIVIDDEVLKQYSKEWKKPALQKDLDRYDNVSKDSRDTEAQMLFQPRGAQIEALYALKNSRREGADKGLVYAVTEQYKRIMAYFKPKFLLGLTATPERMDGRSIYELCDYNVPYQISLQDAVNKGMLVPFHYYGVYDETVDYSGIRKVKGKYDEEELTRELLVNKRYALIYKHYMKYRSQKALGFCCSRKHAEEMAKEFCLRDIPAAAVYSNSDGGYSEDRSVALRKLEHGEIKVIFSVDMFNEGLDISDIDMVMFLRPTESPVVFLQQLGRGLRKSRGKDFLNVLDFIGNYEKAGSAPFLLSGRPYSSAEAGRMQQSDFTFPDDCVVDFDMRLIDLFQEMAKKRVKKDDRVREEYFRIKELLDGRVPSRMELFTYMEDEVYQICSEVKNSPFKHYLRYLDSLKELGAEEEAVYHSIGNELLEMMETTKMTKSYKMPVLMAFYNDGDIKMEIDEEDIYRSDMTFYYTANNWKDLEKDKSTRDFRTWDKKRWVSEALKNPVRFLMESGNGFFIKKEGAVLALSEQLHDAVKQSGFAEQMKDIIEYRVMDYYRKRYEAI